MNYLIIKIYNFLKKITLNKGDVLYKKGEKREKIYFIIKGELELNSKFTLKEINNIIKALGGQLNEFKIDDFLLINPKLKNIFYEKKFNIKIFSLKNNEMSGLDDMTLNNKYLFNCICTSPYKTELFELDYKIFESHLIKERTIFDNHEKYINLKRNIIIRRLLKEKNGLFLNEIKNEKIIMKNEEIIQKDNKEDLKNSYIPQISPDSVRNRSLPLKIQIKKLFQKKKTVLHKRKHYNILTNDYFKNLSSNDFFFNPKMYNTYNKNKNNNKNFDQKSSFRNLKYHSNIQSMTNKYLNTNKEKDKRCNTFDKMNKYNLKTTSYLCKNARKEINNDNDSKDISSSDPDNDENNKDKIINNIFAKNSLGNYFKKIYNIPYIPNFQNTRTKRQIVPFLNKASLKKRKKIQDIINPLNLKETS